MQRFYLGPRENRQPDIAAAATSVYIGFVGTLARPEHLFDPNTHAPYRGIVCRQACQSFRTTPCAGMHDAQIAAAGANDRLGPAAGEGGVVVYVAGRRAAPRPVRRRKRSQS
jgi:hypothetical protein